MSTITKFLALIIILFLAACATPNAGGYTYLLTPPASPDVMVAQATYQAAIAAATSQAAIPTLTAQAQYTTATSQASLSTTQAGATSDAIAIQMTSQAISLDGTRQAQAMISTATFEAIAANGTAQAVNGLATAEAILVNDEAHRLALQRQSEAATIARQQTWNQVWPWLAGIASLSVLVIATSFGYVLIRKSNPVIIKDNQEQPRLIIYGGGVQAIARPARPQIAPPIAPPVPPDDDMKPIELPALTVGHVLIAGETGAGKSTAMQAVLNRRQNVIVLDPHDTPGTWGNNATVIGGGRDFPAIAQFIQQTSHLLDERYQQRANGITTFSPITVATDEMPAIVEELGKEIGGLWRKWLREGRKVNLFFVVSTQSTRVKTLGIEGESDLLENFACVVALGKVATSEYPDLVRGMERPAIIRTVHGARPVIIPHDSASPTGALPDIISPSAPQPFIAPVPQPITTEKWGTITPMEIMTVLRLKRANQSGRAIERTVFGDEGGAAYYKVKAILDTYGHMLQMA